MNDWNASSTWESYNCVKNFCFPFTFWHYDTWSQAAFGKDKLDLVCQPELETLGPGEEAVLVLGVQVGQQHRCHRHQLPKFKTWC